MIGTSEFILIILLILVVVFFVNSIKARELATDAAKILCKQSGVQFLDGTVALTELKPVRPNNGKFHFSRYYQFDYSEDGYNRRHGEVTMIGNTIKYCSLYPTLNR